MDNLSHSVVGLAFGEFIHRTMPSEHNEQSQITRRRLLLTSCWLASNFPDLDLVLKPLIAPPLGYLLHHRGHTHTLLYAIPQALMLFALIWLLWPAARRLVNESATARTGLAISVGAGLGLHILMDYLNSYGVHPFHPFDSRWFYGDMVFILEPFFWVAFGVPLAMMAPRQWLKGILIGGLVCSLIFFTVKGYLSWPSLAALVITAMTLACLQCKAGVHGRSALVLAAILSVGFIGIQRLASDHGKREVAQHLRNNNPATHVWDTAMTPFPSNPLCWIFISIDSNEGADRYRLRRGILSLAPKISPIEKCPASLAHASAQKEATPEIALYFEQEVSLSNLRKLAKTNCHVEAWLRFARAPLLNQARLWDLRFSPDPRENFTTLELEDFENRECSPRIPGWGFPRADLLAPAAVKQSTSRDDAHQSSPK
ncbi:MAG TPA: metal-dependent hydrolase [Burkholderiales bacterium]|jgi:inner membrane protein|nr:metal-dependent hydrolase [Burkholderiales bacterium]